MTSCYASSGLSFIVDGDEKKKKTILMTDYFNGDRLIIALIICKN